MKQTTIQQRDYLFDNAKAFLIFTVVVGHLQGDLSKSGVFPGGNPLWLNSLWQFIFVFHMPVFMAISGYFSKKRVQNNDWISVIDKLVIPYISFQLSLFLMQMVFDYGSTSSFSLLEPRFGSWYIATIAAYQIITPHLLKKKHLFICSLIIALQYHLHCVVIMVDSSVYLHTIHFSYLDTIYQNVTSICPDGKNQLIEF